MSKVWRLSAKAGQTAAEVEAFVGWATCCPDTVRKLPAGLMGAVSDWTPVANRYWSTFWQGTSWNLVANFVAEVVKNFESWGNRNA